MASNFPQFIFVCIFIVFYSDFVVVVCSSQLFNSSLGVSGFSSAVATWYGNATGAGSTGGACGLEDGVAKAPYNAMITAGNQVLFRHGFGCGACYEVLCKQRPHCSGKPIRVSLTDECPEGAYNNDLVRFDLSGTAFGAMAKPRHGEKLRNLGRINIFYKRVACDYKTNIMFKVDKGSNPFFFAVAIEAENGDGALSLVEIKTANSNKWIPMQQMFGATWCVHINPNTQKPPFSLRLTSEYKHQIKANNVIPVGWQSRTIYKSNVNFPNKL
ncbi:expansin-b5 [Nicotiana attenuata]|uniref:Expansin-b5 n=1 Tax=Nicotiana attenuata TaxID=49451 RepID=A0A1J6IZG8_NICAT|nr:expansin-b5 [Nicotiana attenuata]